MKSKVPSHKFSKQLLGPLDTNFFQLKDPLKTNVYLHILFLKIPKVCKDFQNDKPNAIIGTYVFDKKMHFMYR